MKTRRSFFRAVAAVLAGFPLVGRALKAKEPLLRAGDHVNVKLASGLFQNEAGLNVIIPRELARDGEDVTSAITGIQGRFRISYLNGRCIFDKLDATGRRTGELAMVLYDPNDERFTKAGDTSHFHWLDVRRAWDGRIAFRVSEHQTASYQDRLQARMRYMETCTVVSVMPNTELVRQIEAIRVRNKVLAENYFNHWFHKG